MQSTHLNLQLSVCHQAYFNRNRRICNSREITPVYGTCQDKLNILKIIIQLRKSLCISFAPCIIVFTIRNNRTEWLIQWSIIIIVKRDSGIFTQIRASFLSFGHPGLSKRGDSGIHEFRFGHPSIKYQCLVWRCAVVYTKKSVAWTKIRIKWPNTASITHWRRVTTTESHWESSKRAGPPPCWDALNSSFGHP